MEQSLKPEVDSGEIASRSQYHGSIDGYAGDEILGWACWANGDDEPVPVAVFLGEVELSRGLADQYRADLVSVGLGAGRYGFALQVASLRRHADRALTLRADDGTILATYTIPRLIHMYRTVLIAKNS